MYIYKYGNIIAFPPHYFRPDVIIQTVNYAIVFLSFFFFLVCVTSIMFALKVLYIRRNRLPQGHIVIRFQSQIQNHRPTGSQISLGIQVTEKYSFILPKRINVYEPRLITILQLVFISGCIFSDIF